MQIAPLALRRG